MSTSPIQANLAPSWKQEVNRRLEAHKSRKGTAAAEPDMHSAAQGSASGRAAEAAARVAARYAKAPSFSEMLAEEARGAVRAAEAASRAALEAQAAAESILAGLEAASASEHMWEPETINGEASGRGLELIREAAIPPEQSSASQVRERQSFGIRWDADLPVRPAEPSPTRVSRGPGVNESRVEDWWETGVIAQDALGAEGIKTVEPAQPMHANLIEFPRELVATRKVRPRLVEGRYALGEPAAQLSIFEVDPGSISTEPEAADAKHETAAPAWQGAKWSGIELDYQPLGQPTGQTIGQALMETADEDATTLPAPALQLAPFGLRLMAAVVDGALITGVFLMAAAAEASHLKVLPTIKAIELGSALALMAIGVVYHALFFTLAARTPGMKYAGISLCTFDDERPTRAHLRSRLGALLLSLLPVGLGVAWAIFDEEHLTWHDRRSRTYLRRC